MHGCWVFSSASKIISHQTNGKERLHKCQAKSLFLRKVFDTADWLSEGTSEAFWGLLPDLQANTVRLTSLLPLQGVKTLEGAVFSCILHSCYLEEMAWFDPEHSPRASY